MLFDSDDINLLSSLRLFIMVFPPGTMAGQILHANQARKRIFRDNNVIYTRVREESVVVNLDRKGKMHQNKILTKWCKVHLLSTSLRYFYFLQKDANIVLFTPLHAFDIFAFL